MSLTLSLIFKRALFVVAVALVASYLVDSASVGLRRRHATATDPYETLTAPRVYAISEKGNKTEYQLDAENPVQQVTCVHALFPHGGYAPCWQVNRTLRQPIPM
jgi:hypothetical protein